MLYLLIYETLFKLISCLVFAQKVLVIGCCEMGENDLHPKPECNPMSPKNKRLLHECLANEPVIDALFIFISYKTQSEQAIKLIHTYRSVHTLFLKRYLWYYLR